MTQLPFFKKKPSNRYSDARRNNSNLPRKNGGIRAKEVRVVGSDGSQIGVLKIEEALTLAKNSGLDLVEIAPKAQPPVCKILDFGKYLYEEGKKQKKNQKPAATKLKEIKLGATIEKNDYNTKLRHAEEFLYKGNKLKLHLTFRGREMENQTLGREVIANMVKDLLHMATQDAPPNLSGRNLFVLLTPLPANKRVLKYNRKDEEAE